MAGRPFVDRRDAGRQLAAALGHMAAEVPVVVGLPRGGVPVAAEVARRLGAPLDVVIVRKVGVPSQPEIAMGAIGEGGVRIVNDDIVHAARVSPEAFAAAEARERGELERRAAAYRSGRAPLALAGRTVIVVDDGLATGATAKAAIEVVRALGAAQVVLAVPVAPPRTLRELGRHADEVVCVLRPTEFHAVGRAYDDFAPTSDDEVVALLAHQRLPAPSPLRRRPAAAEAVYDDASRLTTTG